MATTMKSAPAPAPAHDVFPINGTDYIEFWVGNAKQAAHFYRSAFGFQLVAYRGPETGVRDRASYLLQQDKIRFVLTTAIRPDLSPEAKEIADHVHKHGDGVRDLALWVEDARDAFSKAVERGAKPVHEPRVMKDKDGEIVVAAFRTYGDTIHSLVERMNYRGIFMPGYVPMKAYFNPAPAGLK